MFQYIYVCACANTCSESQPGKIPETKRVLIFCFNSKLILHFVLVVYIPAKRQSGLQD